jgi:hypothetical protein
MQISAANFLIAAQQAVKAAPQVHAAKPTFEPLEFKQTAAPVRTASQDAPARPGAQLDIKV